MYRTYLLEIGTRHDNVVVRVKSNVFFSIYLLCNVIINFKKKSINNLLTSG